MIGWTNLPADLSVNKYNVVQGKDDFGHARCSLVLPAWTNNLSEQNSIVSSMRLSKEVTE